MNESSRMMMLEEALACIRQQFVEPGNLLARIEMKEEIETNQIEMIEAAFKVIQSAWKDKETVPKEQVRWIRFASDSIPRLERHIQLYPQRKDEIERILSRMHEWIDMIFLPSSESEEVGFALVCQHLLGTRPFNTELLMGRINEDSLGELLSGLRILARQWQTREHISKLAAYAMLSAPRDFEEATQIFSGERLQRLQEVQVQVMESITRCLE